MYGIELPEFIRFVSQLSIAVAAASSLWGFVLARKGHRDMARLLMPLFLISFAAFLVTWWVIGTVLYAGEAAAHEGIALRLEPDDQTEYIQKGFRANTLFAGLLAIVALGSFAAYARKALLFERLASLYFLVQFVLASLIILFTFWTGAFGKTQVFFWLHNWHSVLTVGTVIVVDYLYVVTLRQDAFKRVLYPLFPLMSAAILIGLGIDFFANLLVFEGAFSISEQFLFSQTLVSILIINGALMATRINDTLARLIQKDRVATLPRFTGRLVALSGSISIAAWLSITFVDFFELTLGYAVLLTLYAGAVGAAYIAHEGIEKLLAIR